MRKVTRWLRRSLTMAFCVAGFSLAAQPIAQWDFASGDLTENNGGSSLTSTDALTYPTAGANGVPALPVGANAAAQPTVMAFPKALTGAGGIVMPVPDAANGTAFAIDINNWTLIMDVSYPAESSVLSRSLIDIKSSTEAEGAVDGPEVLVNSAGEVAAGGQGDGSVTADTWHRIAITASYEGDDLAGVATLTKYIDGNQVGLPLNVNTIGPDSWMALKANDFAKLFSDITTAPLSEAGWVSSIQLRGETLGRGQIAAYAGPTTDKIDPVIPQVPSFIIGENTVPSGGFAGPDTLVVFMIEVGDATLTDMSLMVDGVEVLGDAQDSTSGGVRAIIYTPNPAFNLASDHTAVLSYTDTTDGVATSKSAVNEFRIPLHFEDFETIPGGLLAAVDTGLTLVNADAAYSPIPPAGYVVDQTSQDGLTVMYGIDWVEPPSTLDPVNGTTEYRGWTFLNKDWWIAEGGQGRSEYLRGRSTVAVADGDQWDDKGDPDALGTFNSKLITPEIDISGAGEGTVFLAFDSSTRSEVPQEIYIDYSVDGGDFVEVLRWTSNQDDTLKADATNERVSLPLPTLAGASTLQIRFGYEKAENDWWWSVDNIAVDSGPIPASITQQPVGGNVPIGGSITFDVVAGGTEPYSYQWFVGVDEERTEIAGATDSSYTIPVIAGTDSNAYSVDVTNPAGTLSSNDAILYALLPSTPTGDVAGQWDFESGDLTATVGADIVYFEGTGGPTEAATTFGTTTSYAIPDIGGVPANVMAFGAPGPFQGYVASVGAANGDPAATEKNIYTMVYDILWPAAVDANWRTFAQVRDLANTEDAEFFVNTSGAVGVGDTGYYGNLPGGVWHRVAISVDLTAAENPVRYYIDGVLIGAGGTTGIDGRFGIPGAVNFFADENGDNRPGYIASLQVRNEAIDDLQAIALGGPTAAGIPQVIDTGALVPVISSQPLGSTLSSGQMLTLSVDALSGTPETYQWRKEGVILAGFTESTLTVNTVLASEAGSYTVDITNDAGTVTSAAAVVAVVTSVTEGLVAHLTFDSDLTDSSGRGNNGTGMGSTPLATGIIGNAVGVYTDPTSENYVSLGAPADLNFGTDTDFSVSFWINSPGRSSDPSAISNKDWASGSNPGWGIFVTGEKLKMNMSPSRVDRNPGDNDPTAIDGTWHHYVGVFDRDGLFTAYVDGIERGSVSIVSANGNMDTPAELSTNIGQDGTGLYNSGSNGLQEGTLIDDVGIWRRTLSGPEAASIYQQGLAGNDLQSASGTTLGEVTYVPAGGANLQLDWRGQPGAVVQRADDVTGPWTTVPGTDGVSTYTTSDPGFYRVVMP